MVLATMMAGWPGTRELLVILAVAVILFGAYRTHQAIRYIARAIWQYKRARRQVTGGIEEILTDKITKHRS